MRSIMLSTILAAAVAVLGACDPKPDVPNKPPASPTPVTTASPVAVASPSGSPTASPAKTGASPEVKKIDNTNVKKEAAPATPAATATPKK